MLSHQFKVVCHYNLVLLFPTFLPHRVTHSYIFAILKQLQKFWSLSSSFKEVVEDDKISVVNSYFSTFSFSFFVFIKWVVNGWPILQWLSFSGKCCAFLSALSVHSIKLSHAGWLKDLRNHYPLAVIWTPTLFLWPLAHYFCQLIFDLFILGFFFWELLQIILYVLH